MNATSSPYIMYGDWRLKGSPIKFPTDEEAVEYAREHECIEEDSED